jgi:hypothetical protein
MTIANAPTVSTHTQPLLLDVSNTTLTVTPKGGTIPKNAMWRC